MDARNKLIIVVAVICLAVGVGAGLLIPRLLGREECVAKLATGATRKSSPSVLFPEQEVEITNKVAGHVVNGVCVANR